MCIFSSAVRSVAKTRIFAGMVPGGRQALIYSMQVDLANPTAMILPLPVVVGASEDALQFVDLSGYPSVFDDLAKAFVEPVPRGAVAKAVAPLQLAVHGVGDFDASFVPSPADFGRLAPEFRLPAEVPDAFARYADYGFAVFVLSGRADASSVQVHPMALTFSTRSPDQLFFPTVHAHHGEVPEQADFDHALYAGVSRGMPSGGDGWLAATEPVERVVDLDRAGGLIRAGASAHRRYVVGVGPNQDIWLSTG